MKTRPRKDIKRLSTAIRRGIKIGKENGVEHVRDGTLIDVDYETGQVCACALGFALIGLYGVKKGLESGYGDLKSVKSNEINQCLPKVLPSNIRTKIGISKRSSPHVVETVVIGLNDNTQLELEEIADYLEECKL